MYKIELLKENPYVLHLKLICRIHVNIAELWNIWFVRYVVISVIPKRIKGRPDRLKIIFEDIRLSIYLCNKSTACKNVDILTKI